MNFREEMEIAAYFFAGITCPSTFLPLGIYAALKDKKDAFQANMGGALGGILMAITAAAGDIDGAGHMYIGLEGKPLKEVIVMPEKDINFMTYFIPPLAFYNLLSKPQTYTISVDGKEKKIVVEKKESLDAKIAALLGLYQ